MKKTLLSLALMLLAANATVIYAQTDNQANQTPDKDKTAVSADQKDAGTQAKEDQNNSNNKPRFRKMMIDRHKEQWQKMSPEQKEKARTIFRKFQKMSPEEKTRLMQIHKQLQEMPPEKRQALKERLKNMEPARRQELLRKIQTMNPAKRQLIQHTIAMVKQLPEEKRKELKQLPPEERRKEIKKLLEADLNQKLGPEKVQELKKLPPEQRREQLKKLWEEQRLKNNGANTPGQPGALQPQKNNTPPKGGNNR